jgi:hypothetical protein
MPPEEILGNEYGYSKKYCQNDWRVVLVGKGTRCPEMF